jgi:hypothetical protein
MKIKNICCIGAGYLGGYNIAVIGLDDINEYYDVNLK